MLRRILPIFLALLLLIPALAETPAPASDYIQLGDTDDVIGQIQSLLGIVETNADETPIYGDYTQRTVEDYQTENALTVTGDITPETLLLLLDIPADADNANNLVWIPLHGGARYLRMKIAATWTARASFPSPARKPWNSPVQAMLLVHRINYNYF